MLILYQCRVWATDSSHWDGAWAGGHQNYWLMTLFSCHWSPELCWSWRGGGAFWGNLFWLTFPPHSCKHWKQCIVSCPGTWNHCTFSWLMLAVNCRVPRDILWGFHITLHIPLESSLDATVAIITIIPSKWTSSRQQACFGLLDLCCKEKKNLPYFLLC